MQRQYYWQGQVIAMQYVNPFMALVSHIKALLRVSYMVHEYVPGCKYKILRRWVIKFFTNPTSELHDTHSRSDGFHFIHIIHTFVQRDGIFLALCWSCFTFASSENKKQELLLWRNFGTHWVLYYWPAVILLIVDRAKGWKRCGDIAECAEAEGTCGRTSTLTPTAG